MSKDLTGKKQEDVRRSGARASLVRRNKFKGCNIWPGTATAKPVWSMKAP